MFKTEFNSLYVAVKDFILNENNNPDFATPEQEIEFYHSIVDEYNTILFNLENIKNQLDTTNYLYAEIVELVNELNIAFDAYKAKSSIVRGYILELSTLKTKVTFAERLYRFEQSLVLKPLIKIEVDIIQELLVYAKDYTSISTSFYYFTNNPFEIDETLGLLIPVKQSFDTAEKLLTSVYNYALGLYNQYLTINKIELDSMIATEKAIEEKNYEFLDVVNTAKKNKYHVVYGITSEDYYNDIEAIRSSFMIYHNAIVEMGVYRFTAQTKLFESIHAEAEKLINEYTINELYTLYIENNLYDQKLEIFAEYVKLIEDGHINSDKEYIITGTTLKDLTDEIINLSRVIKRKITYTQKYHTSGLPKTFEFEFYQTELFLTSIKSYYYQLMSENIYRYTNLTIDDFGDSSIDDIRNMYKSILGKYFAIMAQDISYMNDFEYVEYYNKILVIQNKLKVQSAIFFDAATKTSPVTYIAVMEQQYAAFLQQLKQDLVNLQSQRGLNLIDITDPNKLVAKDKVESLQVHIESIKNVLNIGNKYVFMGLNDYIDSRIYTPMLEFYNDLKDLYNSEKYIETITLYNDAFKNLIFDFNLLYSIEKFAESVSGMFGTIDTINAFYIEEQVSGKHLTDDHNYEIEFLEDLFADETYKVSRNEMFVQLDVMYEFIIASRPNEKTFLINEKNLKKLYFDNQFMKINYIRWYHKLLLVRNEYDALNKTILSTNQWYLDNKTYIETFGYKARLETLILNQNKTLSEITKMLVDYATDTNYATVNLSSDIIRNIETYNLTASVDISKYIDIVEKLKRIQTKVEIDNRKNTLELTHKTQWIDIIQGNRISEPIKVSYNEMDTITGSVPLTVALEAKMETIVDATGTEISATFTWFIGTVTKVGSKITHTFYTEGKQQVRCEISYSTGEKSSKYLEFDIKGPQNSQIVKSGTQTYAPLDVYTDQPKITYKDPATGNIVTVAIKIDGNVTDMIGTGAITLAEDGDLVVEKIGKVILGFDGVEFAGSDFDYSQIFGDAFEMPTEAEFLFDFNISTPIAGTASIDISTSQYTNFMAKLPTTISSVYEIAKASEFSSIGNVAKITIGDKLILKNGYGRYAVIEIGNIITLTEPDNGKYYYSVEFNYYVNTSLNQYDRDVFKPQQTDMVVPTLVFKTDVREMFNSLIVRLEEINDLKSQLDASLDAESFETISTQIADLEAENQAFYLFEELDKIRAKYYSLNTFYNDLSSTYSIDFTQNIAELDLQIDKYSKHIDNTKTFEEYMTSIHAYEFRKNLVDLKVLVDLYKDQETILEMIIGSYEYKDRDANYFKNMLTNFRLISTNDIVDTSLAYGPMLVKMVTKLRELLFKLKLIINFPIMSEGKHIILSEPYLRLKEDLATGVWSQTAEADLFMLNKKLELRYGYESAKVEAGNPYKDFIANVAFLEKSLFGKGLSSVDIKNISNYIQVVEDKVISEYDDFFMIPFWIDYLEKNV